VLRFLALHIFRRKSPPLVAGCKSSSKIKSIILATYPSGRYIASVKEAARPTPCFSPYLRLKEETFRQKAHRSNGLSQSNFCGIYCLSAILLE
jgi:hypothetical protein